MKKWERFENECAVFLSKILNFDNIVVYQNGGSNSNDGDIDLFHDNELITNIECKLSPSQSGQFVIVKEGNSFTMSNKNKNRNKFSEKILKVINQEDLNPKDQKKIEIKLPNDILQSWIIDHYSSKKTDFIITSNKLNSFKALVPLSELSNYFEMEAVLRRKRSGSHHVPRKKIDLAQKQVKDFIENIDGKVNDFKIEDNKLWTDVLLENKKESYYLENTRFFLRYDDEKNKYIVKELSQTNNLTVIFEIKYIGPHEDINQNKLIELIKTNY